MLSLSDQPAAPATSPDAVATAYTFPSPPSKPKRPLSGYNLFYRFKRNKVLEATARLQRGAGPEEERLVIEDVLSALPGLEGVPPGHEAWTFPAPKQEELRASNIRRDMDGKLFPNENARSRLHRKVLGMGFVEMGRVMREKWSGLDDATKGVFCELADVGRVRYKMLIEDYKLKGGAKGPRKPRAKKNKKAEDPVPVSVAGAPADVVDPTSPMVIEATPVAPAKASVVDLVTPSPVVNGQRDAIRAGIAPLCPLPGSRRVSDASPACIFGEVMPVQGTMKDDGKSPGGGFDPTEPLAVSTPNYGRRVTTESMNGLGPTEPLAAPTPTFERLVSAESVNYPDPTEPLAAPAPSFERLVTAESANGLDSPAVPAQPVDIPTSFADFLRSSSNGAAYQRMNSLFEQFLRSAVLPPPPLVAAGSVDSLSQRNGYANIAPAGITLPDPAVLSQRSPLSDMERAILSDGAEPEPVAPSKDVSTKDFLELIGTLDEALDGDGMDSMEDGVQGGNDAADGCSMIFGKPIHDVQTRNTAVLDVAAMNNFGSRMNNLGARTA